MSSTFWDERFRGNEYAYGREPNDFLRAEAHRIPAGPVLCLAEGEGRNAVFLAGLGHEVTAVDFSLEGLRKTERLAREHGVALEVNGLAARLDLSGEHVREALRAGVRIVCSTDAHSTRGLGNMPLSVHTARRGGATRADVLNAGPLSDLRR